MRSIFEILGYYTADDLKGDLVTTGLSAILAILAKLGDHMIFTPERKAMMEALLVSVGYITVLAGVIFRILFLYNRWDKERLERKSIDIKNRKEEFELMKGFDEEKMKREILNNQKIASENGKGKEFSEALVDDANQD